MTGGVEPLAMPVFPCYTLTKLQLNEKTEALGPRRIKHVFK